MKHPQRLSTVSLGSEYIGYLDSTDYTIRQD